MLCVSWEQKHLIPLTSGAISGSAFHPPSRGAIPWRLALLQSRWPGLGPRDRLGLLVSIVWPQPNARIRQTKFQPLALGQGRAPPRYGVASPFGEQDYLP